MFFIVYILYSHSVKKFYAGQTDNPELRLIRHNQSLVKSTKPGIPWILLWSLAVPSRSEALKIEKKIKKGGISRFMNDLKFDYQSLVNIKE